MGLTAAEGALEAADNGLRAVRWQILVATLAVWLQEQHGVGPRRRSVVTSCTEFMAS